MSADMHEGSQPRESDSAQAKLPEHVRETIDAIAQLHAQANADATAPQRAIERLTKRLAQPLTVVAVAGFVILWILANVLLKTNGKHPFDEFPFSALQGLLTLGALVMTILILTAEARLDQFAESRSRLGLQIALLTEQKVAKVIELLDQQRRDDPRLRNRPDESVQAMKASADPQALLEALEESHGGKHDE